MQARGGAASGWRVRAPLLTKLGEWTRRRRRCRGVARVVGRCVNCASLCKTTARSLRMHTPSRVDVVQRRREACEREDGWHGARRVPAGAPKQKKTKSVYLLLLLYRKHNGARAALLGEYQRIPLLGGLRSAPVFRVLQGGRASTHSLSHHTHTHTHRVTTGTGCAPYVRDQQHFIWE